MIMPRIRPAHPVLKLALAVLFATTLSAEPGNQVVFELSPTSAIPRNSEGAFATLKDGRIAFYYTQFYGGDKDHSAARIAAIDSADGGTTWGPPREIVAGVGDRGLNVMSVSLLRLARGRLALFYLFTKDAEDCRPYLSYSSDEGASWSAPRLLLEHPGYYILNNDRVIQTRSGRLIMPMNLHRKAGTRGQAVWYYSDDDGATWRESDSRWSVAQGRSGLQESGVVETANGTLFSWARTDLGSQYEFRSYDNGVTWSAPAAGNLVSPLSPASIKRLPDTDDLVALYNDHSGRFPFVADMRTPLVAAISRDGGHSWPIRRLVEDNTRDWYHYTAIHCLPDAMLVAYNAGNDRMAEFRSPLRIRRIEYSWLRAQQTR